MKKVHWKSFTLGIVFAIALAVGLGEVSAASTIIVKNLQATYNNIKIIVNAKEANLGKDLSGKKIEPFIINGTTYLPVRAVSEALGETVNWDGKENKVYIGTYPGIADSLYKVAYPYKMNDVSEASFFGGLNISGVTHSQGFEFYNKNSYMHSNLQGKYTTLKFDIGTLRSDGYVTSLMNIYLDEKLYTSIKVHSNELQKKITIPVKGVHQIRFDTVNAATNHVIGIGSPTLYFEK